MMNLFASFNLISRSPVLVFFIIYQLLGSPFINNLLDDFIY